MAGTAAGEKIRIADLADPVLSDADLYILIGSDAWSEGENAAVSALIRQAFADGKPVAGICAVAALLLLINGYDGYSAVLVQQSRLGELSRQELLEIITDAWATKAPKKLVREHLGE